MEEKNFSRGGIVGKSFEGILEMWLSYSKLILFKEGLSIFILREPQEFEVLFICFFEYSSHIFSFHCI